MTESIEDPKALAPGTVLRHESGGRVTLARRKENGSGWWNTDGSGLDDRAAVSGHWSVEPGSKNLGFRITELWAFVADADDGDEGLIAMQTPNGWIPMVCADRQRIDQMRTYAVEVARQTNQTVKLIHFGGERSEIEVYPGSG